LKLYVDDLPQVYEADLKTWKRSSPKLATPEPLKLPVSFWGALDPAGDTDEIEFESRAGEADAGKVQGPVRDDAIRLVVAGDGQRAALAVDSSASTASTGSVVTSKCAVTNGQVAKVVDAAAAVPADRGIVEGHFAKHVDAAALAVLAGARVICEHATVRDQRGVRPVEHARAAGVFASAPVSADDTVVQRERTLVQDPAAIPVSTDNFILGELYRLKNEDEFDWAMAQLDDYEGIDPENGKMALFRRDIATVFLETIQTEAWIYWYDGNVSGHPVIDSGDVLLYLQEKKSE